MKESDAAPAIIGLRCPAIDSMVWKLFSVVGNDLLEQTERVVEGTGLCLSCHDRLIPV